MKLAELLSTLRQFGVRDFEGATEDAGNVKLQFSYGLIEDIGQLAKQVAPQEETPLAKVVNLQSVAQEVEQRKETDIDIALDLTRNPGRLYPEGGNE